MKDEIKQNDVYQLDVEKTYESVKKEEEAAELEGYSKGSIELEKIITASAENLKIIKLDTLNTQKALSESKEQLKEVDVALKNAEQELLKIKKEVETSLNYQNKVNESVEKAMKDLKTYKESAKKAETQTNEAKLQLENIKNIMGEADSQLKAADIQVQIAEKRVNNIYSSITTLIISLLGLGVLYSTINSLINSAFTELFKQNTITSFQMISSILILTMGSIIAFMYLTYFMFSTFNQFIYNDNSNKFNESSPSVKILNRASWIFVLMFIIASIFIGLDTEYFGPLTDVHITISND